MPVGIRALRDPISPTDPFFAWWHACGASVPQPFLAGLAKEASAMPAARWRGILDEVRMTDLAAEARAVRVRTLIIA
ncbi:alpha/beta hydrolase, partial [Mesorhizobium sp. M2D.F.Ca.ET.140.01.1.1]